jgi:beta-alanine--pyruvate transaminase
MAVAAGLAALDVYAAEGLFQRVTELAPVWEDAIHSLKGLPHVIDLRNYGLVGAVELEPVPGAPMKRAMDVFAGCWEEGVLIRTTGDNIALSPPFVIDESQIAQIVDTIGRVLKKTA